MENQYYYKYYAHNIILKLSIFKRFIKDQLFAFSEVLVHFPINIWLSSAIIKNIDHL